MRALFLPFLAFLALAGILAAQSPKPIVVQAATPAVKSQAPAVAAADNAAAISAALKALQEMKAVNEATLRKQAAALEQLDLIQQAADQLKIYSKRG